MSSPAQLAANTANAQKSTGPKTESGKQRTRLNAYRHGLTGQICISAKEDQDAFDQHCDGIRRSLEPVGALEIGLAQSIAEDKWRLQRARSIERGIFALGQSALPAGCDGGEAQARTWLADGRKLQLLTLYEQRIHRTIERNMATISALQTKRHAARQQALQEAQLLFQPRTSTA